MPELHKFFLRGRYHCRPRTRESLPRGIEYLEQAVRLDPSYAPALASLAEFYVLLAWYGFSPAFEAMPKSRAAAVRAREIDARLAQAHMCLALVRELDDWDWQRAQDEFRAAYELDPTDEAVLFEWELLVSRLGRPESGLELMRRAAEADLLSAVVQTNLGVKLDYLRRFQNAIRSFHEAMEREENYYPAHFRLGMTLLQTGDVGAAMASRERARSLCPDCPLVAGLLGRACGAGERRQLAPDLLGELDRMAPLRRLSRALLWIGFGESARAVDCLESACCEREPRLVDLKIDPMYDALRDEPRFQGILRRMNLLM